MRTLRTLFLLLAVLPATAPAHPHADADAEDARLAASMLALVQQVVRLAAQSPDPQAMRKGIDGMLAGHNREANRFAAELLGEILRDAPPEHHAMIGSIARDVVAMARRDLAREAALGEPASTQRALQARRDLHAMGLRYYDSAQFLDAAGRDDVLAVELFLRARGVNPQVRDAEGRTALDLARRNGNRRMIAILSGTGAEPVQ